MYPRKGTLWKVRDNIPSKGQQLQANTHSTLRASGTQGVT